MGEPFAGTVINVTDYGATGDDKTKTDDTDELLAAITAAKEGGALYFPPGTYHVSRPLIPLARQVYIGDAATIKVVRGTTPFAVFDVNVDGVAFHRLTLDLSRRADDECVDDAPAAISVRAPADGAVELVVSSCQIRHGHGQGILVAGGGAGRDRVVVRDTLVEDCCESGLTLNKVYGARVEDSRFVRCRNGIQVASSRDVIVRGATVTKNRRHGIAISYSHEWHVEKCVATDNGGEETDRDKLRGWGIAAGGGRAGETPNNEFTITKNLCDGNYAGGITLDPTIGTDPTRILAQRARISGNVCRGRKGGTDMGGDDPLGSHGIHVRNSRDVVVTDNLCHHNEKCGIAVVNSAHALVQANASWDNNFGIGLFGHVDGDGGHVIGVNMLHDNDNRDLQQGTPTTLRGVRLYGLNGKLDEETKANPGTLFESHEGDEGALYVKAQGSGAAGWVKVAG
jgi:parallel beta-helix repeat protein